MDDTKQRQAVTLAPKHPARRAVEEAFALLFFGAVCAGAGVGIAAFWVFVLRQSSAWR